MSLIEQDTALRIRSSQPLHHLLQSGLCFLPREPVTKSVTSVILIESYPKAEVARSLLGVVRKFRLSYFTPLLQLSYSGGAAA